MSSWALFFGFLVAAMLFQVHLCSSVFIGGFILLLCFGVLRLY